MGGCREQPAAPAGPVLQDDAGLFRQHPEQREELEARLVKISQERKFHAKLVISRDLHGEDIAVACRKLCSSQLAVQSGCMMLYEEKSGSFHLSPPLTTGYPQVDLDTPYVSTPWLEEQFLHIKDTLKNEQPELEKHAYVNAVVSRLIDRVEAHVEPVARQHNQTLWFCAAAFAAGAAFFSVWIFRRSSGLPPTSTSDY